MTPKIDSVSSTVASSLATPVKSAASAPAAATSVATQTPAAPVDKVSITGDAVRLQQLDRSTVAESREPPVDNKRVASLRSAIASGRYQVDTKTLATKLSNMEEDLSST